MSELARLEAAVAELTAQNKALREEREALRASPASPEPPIGLVAFALVAALVVGLGGASWARVATAPKPASERVCAEVTMPPDATIALERTECFGSCPAYTITLYASGRVTFDGVAWVRTKHGEGHVLPSEVEGLFRRLTSDCFLEAREAYGLPIPDASQVAITVSYGGRRQCVAFTQGGLCTMLERLAAHADAIDRLAGAQGFIGTDPPAKPSLNQAPPIPAPILTATVDAGFADPALVFGCRLHDGTPVAHCPQGDPLCTCAPGPATNYPRFVVPRTNPKLRTPPQR